MRDAKNNAKVNWSLQLRSKLANPIQPQEILEKMENTHESHTCLFCPFFENLIPDTFGMFLVFCVSPLCHLFDLAQKMSRSIFYKTRDFH